MRSQSTAKTFILYPRFWQPDRLGFVHNAADTAQTAHELLGVEPAVPIRLEPVDRVLQRGVHAVVRRAVTALGSIVTRVDNGCPFLYNLIKANVWQVVGNRTRHLSVRGEEIGEPFLEPLS